MRILRHSAAFVFTLAAALFALGCRDESPSPTAPDASPAASVTSAAALNFSQISTGLTHACGTTTDGRAWCWGSNAQGQLGVPLGQSKECEPSNPCSVRPVAVAGGHLFLHVTAGWDFSCGVATDDRIYCWGKNDLGQLGTGGTGAFNPVPAPVAGNRKFRQVNAWNSTACGVTASHAGFCWGGNAGGQLGNGTDLPSPMPTRIGGPPGLLWSQLTVGAAHACGIATDKRAWCWGTNAFGQLGDGTRDSHFVPGLVHGTLSVAQIDAGHFHTCAVTTSRQAYCWGDGIASGTGAGSGPVVEPRLVAGQRKWDNISSGTGFNCAVTVAGRGFCWGSGASGALGNGTNLNKTNPAAVAGSLSFEAVSAGPDFSCGVVTNGQGWCWGSNSRGQLGDGSLVSKMTPSPVLGP